METIVIRADQMRWMLRGLAMCVSCALCCPSSTAVAQQAADPTEPSAKVVVRAGEQSLTVSDLKSDPDAELDYEQSSAGRLEVPHVDASDSTMDPGVRAVARQYALRLLLASAAVREGLDRAPGFPAQASPIERIDWLAKNEIEKIKTSPVARDEISAYYNSHSADFERAEIDTVGIRIADAPGAAGLSRDQATLRAHDIRRDFEKGMGGVQVAAQDTVPGVVFIRAQILQKDDWPPEMADRVFALNDGGFLEVDDAEGAVVLVHMVRRIHPSLAEVSGTIESIVRAERLQHILNDIDAKSPVWVDEAWFGAAPGRPDR
jgi:hypothetical protein